MKKAFIFILTAYDEAEISNAVSVEHTEYTSISEPIVAKKQLGDTQEKGQRTQKLSLSFLLL